jgi:hypothetical protein
MEIVMKKTLFIKGLVIQVLCLAHWSVAFSQTTSNAAPVQVHLGQPTTGFTFFNKPGATKTLHDSDLRGCLLDVKEVVSWDEYINNNQSLMAQIMLGGRSRAARLGALENCMVARGWRVVAVPNDRGTALAAMSSNDVSQALTSQVGAEQPEGTVVRIWSNEVLDARNMRNEIAPSALAEGQLSLLSIGDIDDILNPIVTYDLNSVSRLYDLTMNDRWKIARGRGATVARPLLKLESTSVPGGFERKISRNLKVNDISTIPEGWGIILLRLTGTNLRNGLSITMAPNQGPLLQAANGTILNSPDFLKGMLNRGAGSDGSWFMRAVPPGAYRYKQIGTIPLEFCLGSPAFEVKSGEIIYAGAFDLSAQSMGPDMSIEPVRQLFDGASSFASVKPASYVNGSVGFCLGGAAIYALEFSGYPYVDGYEWGSKASQRIGPSPP